MNLFDRHMKLLGVDRQPPSLEALREIVAAQLTNVPFENVSKLYYRNRPEGGRLPVWSGISMVSSGITSVAPATPTTTI